MAPCLTNLLPFRPFFQQFLNLWKSLWTLTLGVLSKIPRNSWENWLKGVQFVREGGQYLSNTL